MLDNAPGDIDGVSLMPTFKGESIRKNGALFFHYPHYHHLGYKPAGAVRYGDYKLIEWFEETLLGLEGQVNLYNVATDVGETTDLAAEMPEKVAEMRAMMKAWRQSVDAQEMWINDSPDPARENSRFAE